MNLREDRPMLSVEECSPETLVFGSVRFLQIFARLPNKNAVESVFCFGHITFGFFGDSAKIILW